MAITAYASAKLDQVRIVDALLAMTNGSGMPEEDFQPSLDASGSVSLTLSDEAQRYLGKFVPANTKRTNQNALRAFARFAIDVDYKTKYFQTEPHLRSYLLEDPDRCAR